MKIAAVSSDEKPGSPLLRVYIPALLFVTCLAAQLYLVFNKSFNWDEFIHFSQVYQLKAGNFIQPFQVFHLRMLGWAPGTAVDLLDQMRAARLFMWATHLLTLFMIYGVARQFTSASNAFFGSFAYLTAGYVFGHAFSIRSDPFVTAALMCALFTLAKGEFGWTRAIVAGLLLGLAGMFSVKAIFYAPCFAGLAWLKFRKAPRKPEFLARFAAFTGAAFLSFATIYFYHTSGAAEVAPAVKQPATVSFFLRWFTIGMPFGGFIIRETILAPLFALGILLAPLAWKKAGLNADERVALAGFIAPLIVLIFYRNTFPYFFTFILAPVAVAIAPALGMVRDRYGNAFLAVVLTAAPIALAILEPRDMIRRQEALINYVHNEFPSGTRYLDYSAMIADYPRILTHLTSGNGLRLYHEAGDPIIAREINRGQLPFIIANHNVIAAVLENRPNPETFLPGDLEAIRGNYVRQWGVLWREGTYVPNGQDDYVFELRRAGTFVLAGGPVVLDNAAVTPGAKITLRAGRHLVKGDRRIASTLWRGDRLPTPPPSLPLDSVFTTF